MKYSEGLSNRVSNIIRIYIACMFVFNCVSFVFLVFVYVFLLLYMFCIFCCHRANWHSSPTLTEVFLCSFLSCKANARV